MSEPNNKTEQNDKVEESTELSNQDLEQVAGGATTAAAQQAITLNKWKGDI